MITKEKSGTAKIDPLMAGFNAFALLARNPQAAGHMNIDDFLGGAVMAMR
jgi:phage terminase large subunit-like protein